MPTSKQHNGDTLSALPAPVKAILQDDVNLGPQLARLADDPWSLSRRQRQDLLDAFVEDQARWLDRLSPLIEPPELAQDFPAFLLATPPFGHIARSIAEARSIEELDTATADELQRFVDHYRNYMLGSEEDREADRGRAESLQPTL